jgi:hypothetical protein
MHRVLIDFAAFPDLETADESSLRAAKQTDLRHQKSIATPEEPCPEFRKARASA